VDGRFSGECRCSRVISACHPDSAQFLDFDVLHPFEAYRPTIAAVKEHEFMSDIVLELIQAGYSRAS